MPLFKYNEIQLEKGASGAKLLVSTARGICICFGSAECGGTRAARGPPAATATAVAPSATTPSTPSAAATERVGRRSACGDARREIGRSSARGKARNLGQAVVAARKAQDQDDQTSKEGEEGNSI